jgi:hypothetical protein
MGFNRRKMDDERRREAEKQAAAKRALDPQVRADALLLVTEWNERQAQSTGAIWGELGADHFAASPVRLLNSIAGRTFHRGRAARRSPAAPI